MTSGFASRSRVPGHLSTSHPLAAVAARHCAEHRGPLRVTGIGGVACGACWERAIRDDERVAAEFGLPPEVSSDPMYVDEIAVELVCRGERHGLTPVERAEVVRRLDAAGLNPGAIAARLSTSFDAVRTILAGLSEAIELVPVDAETATAAGGDAAEVA
jgi:hypothetical protein